MAADIFRERSCYSQLRIDELKTRLRDLDELAAFPNLAVFAAGSYGRLEASQYSDLDVFLLSAGDKEDLDRPRTHQLRLFGRVIETVEKMNFPEFSNDCEYLTVLHMDHLAIHLGSPRDDYENYFTARMLLLLESTCLYGDTAYQTVMRHVISSYFKDYHDHPTTFWPTFLLNDICRFWKTLLLNYENRRNLPVGTDERKKTKAKVKNFKLKFSRMTTCFASIAALGCHRVPVTEEQVMHITTYTPRRRLEFVAERVTGAKTAVADVLDRYAWFLEMTGLPTAKLEEHFSDKEKRTEMFKKANDYGNAMFKLLLSLDDTDTQPRFLRYLVI